MSSKRKEIYWSVDSSPSDSLFGPLINDIGNTRAHLRSTVTAPQVKKKTSRRSTLKTLCQEDKHKVRKLIEDLAKTGAEKDAIEQLLKKERNEYDERLSQLQLEQQSLIEERTMERSLHDSELKLQAIKSENDKVVNFKTIPVFCSASAGPHLQSSHDHPAPPTTVVNLDHSLNYLLQPTNSNVQPPECLSSSTSISSLVSSLHTMDDQELSTAVDHSVPTPRLLEPHLTSGRSDVAVQTRTLTDSAVQTDQCNIVPLTSSHQSVITSTSSSDFDQKMEHMMATALLNAKDTVNTIEALSQSLLLKTVSRESSFVNVPLHHQMTSTQCVANNEGVANSQDVANTPRMTTIQELANSHTSQYNSHQVDERTHVTPSGHPNTSSHADHMTSHANHMITPPQHNYTLYDTGHHHDDNSLYLNRDDKLQLEDLAETLNNSTVPMGWLQDHHPSSKGSTSHRTKTTSNAAMATQPVGEHLIINHSDSDVINDLFFLQ